MWQKQSSTWYSEGEGQQRKKLELSESAAARERKKSIIKVSLPILY